MSDYPFYAIAAPLDDRLSDNDRTVMAAIARGADIDLDGLCRVVRLPRPHVFYAVARLEDLGYLRIGEIR